MDISVQQDMYALLEAHHQLRNHAQQELSRIEEISLMSCIAISVQKVSIVLKHPLLLKSQSVQETTIVHQEALMTHLVEL